jgi:hypothetical protein
VAISTLTWSGTQTFIRRRLYYELMWRFLGLLPARKDGLGMT